MIITTIDKIPPELSVSHSFLESILSVLEKTDGVFAFLPIKIGAIDLHQLILNRKNYPQFNANMIPKPLGVKKKSEVDAFIHVNQEYVDKLNAKLKKQNIDNVTFLAINLSYPLTHLGHLIKTNSIKIDEIDTENRILYAKHIDGKFLYKVFLPKDINLTRINDLEYLINGQEQFIYLDFFDNDNQHIKVLGMQSLGLNDNYWPIFSDLDAHSYSEKVKSNNNNNNAEIFYDTSKEEDWKNLLEVINTQIQTNALLQEIQKEKTITAEDMISRVMGQIRLSEVIAYFLFNVSVGRYHPALNLIQHGSTLDLSPEQALKVNKKIIKTGVQTAFPKIDDTTKIGALCPNGKLIYCEGIEVVLFYQIMNEHNYQFPINPWNYSTDFSPKQIQQLKQNIYEELIEGGVLENKNPSAAVNANDFSMENPSSDDVIEMPLLEQKIQTTSQHSGFFSRRTLTPTISPQQNETENVNTNQRCCRGCVLV